MLILLILLNSCTMLIKHKNELSSNDIRCIKVSEVFPFINNEGKLYKYDTPTVKIYYYRNFTIYELGYHFDSTSNRIHITSEYRNHFFVHQNGDKYGYDYDKFKSIFGIKISVDSVLKEQWVIANKLYPIFTQNTVTLISSNYNRDSAVVHEIYSLKSKQDTSMTGAIYLSFTDKIKAIDYSLCKELDSIKNMKLYYAKIINNSRYVKMYNITIEQAEQAFWLEELPVTNREEILSYVERYEKDRLKD